MDIRKGRHDTSKHPIPKVLKNSLYLLLLSTLVLALVLAPVKIKEYFPIKNVKVYGISKLDPAEVQNILIPLVKNSFFTVKVDLIRERLRQLPWVADILVRRNWPDGIEVTVIEKAAIAFWNQSSLLSNAGDIFTPPLNTFPKSLPELRGPLGQHIFMLNYFNQINELLKPLHVKIEYLELSPYLTWRLVLDNGITLQLGHKDILTRLHQFVKVYAKIIGNRSKDVEYVDLRYPNGVSVHFKNALQQSPNLALADAGKVKPNSN